MPRLSFGQFRDYAHVLIDQKQEWQSGSVCDGFWSGSLARRGIL